MFSGSTLQIKRMYFSLSNRLESGENPFKKLNLMKRNSNSQYLINQSWCCTFQLRRAALVKATIRKYLISKNIVNFQGKKSGREI